MERVELERVNSLLNNWLKTYKTAWYALMLIELESHIDSYEDLEEIKLNLTDKDKQEILDRFWDRYDDTNLGIQLGEELNYFLYN